MNRQWWQRHELDRRWGRRHGGAERAVVAGALLLFALAILAGCSGQVVNHILLGPDANIARTPGALTSRMTPTPMATATPTPIAKRPLSVRASKPTIKPGDVQTVTVSGTPLTFVDLRVEYSNGIMIDAGTHLGAEIDAQGQFVDAWTIDRYAPGGQTTVKVRTAGVPATAETLFIIEAPAWPNPAGAVQVTVPTVVPGPLQGVPTALPGEAPTPTGPRATPSPGPRRTAAPTPGPLAFRTWVASLTVPSSGGSETIYGQLHDPRGKPMTGGRLYAIGHFPVGHTEVWLSDRPTDATGNTTIAFTVPPIPRGYRVTVNVYMNWEGHTFSDHVSFIGS